MAQLTGLGDLTAVSSTAGHLQSRDTEDCDYTIHEVHRYCELLLSGDPRCVETLFLHPSSIYSASSEWHEFCQQRDLFLNR